MYLEEYEQKLKKFKTKEEALSNKEDEQLILFEIYQEENIIEAYFVLDENIYNKLSKEYKLKGVEI